MGEIPKEIADKIKQAEEIEKALREAEKKVSSGAEEETPTVEETAKSQNQKEEIVDSGDGQVEEKLSEEKGTPEEEPHAEESTAPEEAPKDNEAEEWKNRFIGLKKHHDKLVHQLRIENKALQETVATMQEKIKKLEPLAQKAQEFESKEISSKLSEELGEDTAKVLEHFMQKVVNPLKEQNEALMQEVNRLKGLTVETLTTQNTMSITDRVRQHVPDFDVIDTDPAFQQWIQQVDQISGKTVADLIASAAENGNISYIVGVYNAYRDMKNQTTQQPEPQPQQTVTEQPMQRQEQQQPVQPKQQATQQPSRNLQARVVPTSTATSAEQVDDKRIWHQDEIKQFYVDKALNKIDPKIAAKLEADINAAVAEGRVVR